MGIDAQGGCICGAVRYSVKTHPKWVINCGCGFCQRATGGHYLVEAMIPRDALEILTGTPKSYSRRSEGSGKEIHIHFCDTCGTKVFTNFERYGDICGVFAGTFDDPNWFPRTPETTFYFFLGEMADGVVIPAGFNVYYGHSLKLDGTNNTPQRFDIPTEVTVDLRNEALKFAQRNGEA